MPINYRSSLVLFSGWIKERAEITAEGKAGPALAVNDACQSTLDATALAGLVWRNQSKSECEYQNYLNLRLTGGLCASACNAATRWYWDVNAALDAATDECGVSWQSPFAL